MNRNRIWIISTLPVLILLACSSHQSPPTPTASIPATLASNSPESKKTKTSSVVSNPDKAQASLIELKSVVTQTKGAVELNKFAKAKEEFSKFETYWEKVEDGIKTKSAATYKAIENDLDNITNGLRIPNPDKVKLLSDLQSLSKTLNTYTASASAHRF